MLQLIMGAWFVSSAALALGVVAACDKMFGTFSCGPRLAPVRTRHSGERRAPGSARRET